MSAVDVWFLDGTDPNSESLYDVREVQVDEFQIDGAFCVFHCPDDGFWYTIPADRLILAQELDDAPDGEEV